MALVTRFDTPASLRDLPPGSAFYDDWHTHIANRLGASTPGSGGGEFYDASETDVNIVGARDLVWMAFPRRVLMPNRDDRGAAFTAAENRNVQDEYCEWFTTRNAAGKIVRVTFVTEAPEYWEALWAVDRARVVALYRALVSPAVVETDLHVGGVYQRANLWNNANGIVHLRQAINTLNAALGLAQGSANSAPARDNYEMSAVASTAVDPRVTYDVGTLVRKGLSVTLRDPIGLYIAGWDDTGWTRPSGAPVGNYWTIVRGVPGQVLRLDYEVPAAVGFVVGDIRIGGRPIQWGGQLAEHVTVTIGGVAGGRAR
ncbi:MAG: hypothetical protein ABI593_03105 [Betaproteobacteria bacterium]